MARDPTTRTEQVKEFNGLFDRVIFPSEAESRAVVAVKQPLQIWQDQKKFDGQIVEGEWRPLLPSLKELMARFVLKVVGLGLQPELIDLSRHHLRLRPIEVTPLTLTPWPKEAQSIYRQVQRLDESKYFNDWTVLQEVPPPAPPPRYRLDPYLAVRLAEGHYLSVFHWD